MIDLETVARIRHLHHAERWPVGTIVAELGLHHETVEKALEEQPRALPRLRPSKLDPCLGFMRETLDRYPQLRATRLWRMLVIVHQRPGTANGFVSLSLENATGFANVIATPSLFDRKAPFWRGPAAGGGCRAAPRRNRTTFTSASV